MGAFWVHTDLSVLWHQCEFPHFTQCCCSLAFMSPAQSSLRHPPNPHFIFSWFSTCISHFHLLYFSFPPSWYFQRHIFQLCWPIVQYLLMPDSEIRSSWVGLVWGGDYGSLLHVLSIVAKKWDPGILDPSRFSGQIRKVEARLGKLAKIRKVETN